MAWTWKVWNSSYDGAFVLQHRVFKRASVVDVYKLPNTQQRVHEAKFSNNMKQDPEPLYIRHSSISLGRIGTWLGDTSWNDCSFLPVAIAITRFWGDLSFQKLDIILEKLMVCVELLDKLYTNYFCTYISDDRK